MRLELAATGVSLLAILIVPTVAAFSNSPAAVSHVAVRFYGGPQDRLGRAEQQVGDRAAHPRRIDFLPDTTGR